MKDMNNAAINQVTAMWAPGRISTFAVVDGTLSVKVGTPGAAQPFAWVEAPKLPKKIRTRVLALLSK